VFLWLLFARLWLFPMMWILLLRLEGNVVNKDKAEVPTAEGQVAPLLSSASASRNIIEDSYIIVFKDDIDASAIINHQVWVETVHNENINLLRTRNIQLLCSTRRKQITACVP
jgi:hypothetical protein